MRIGILISIAFSAWATQASADTSALSCPSRFKVTYDNFVKHPLNDGILKAADVDEVNVLVGWSKINELSMKSLAFTFEKKLRNGVCVYRKKYAKRGPLESMPVQARLIPSSRGVQLKVWFREQVKVVSEDGNQKVNLNYQVNSRVQELVPVRSGGIILHTEPGQVSVRYNHNDRDNIFAGKEVPVGLARTVYTDRELPKVTMVAICSAVYLDYYEYGDTMDEQFCLESSEFTVYRESPQKIDVKFIGDFDGKHTCYLSIKKPIHLNKPEINRCRYVEP